MNADEGLEDARARRVWRRAVLVVALLALAAYANTLANRPLYDDAVLSDNPALRSPWNLRAIFGGTWWGAAKPDSALWRPLSAWTLAWNGWWNERVGLGFLSVTGFHVFNALVHAGCAWLVAELARAVGLRALAGACAGALFAVLAIHVEAVTPITARSETLAALFGLSGLLVHARGARTAPLRSAIASALCFFAACACKESALAFAPVAVALDLCVRRARPSVASLIAWGSSILLFVGLRWLVVSDVRGAVYFVDNPLVTANLGERWLTAAAVQFDYARHLVLPLAFRSDASYAEPVLATSLFDTRVLGALALLAGCALLVWRASASRGRFLFAFAVYAGLFAVTSNVLVVIGTPRAERLVYAPSIGFCLCVATALDALSSRTRAVRIGALALVVLLGCWNLVACWQRNAVWRDPATFFRAQVEEAPQSAKAHFNFGVQLGVEGDDRGAIAQYEHALRIHARYHEAWHNLGGALRRVGERERALQAYQRAIECMSGFLPPRFGVVQTLFELQRIDEARAELERLERDAPRHPWIAPTRRLLGLPAR